MNRKINKEIEEAVINQYKNGMNVFDICAKYNISNRTFYIILKNNNITCNRRKQLTEQEVEQIINEYTRGDHIKVIIKKYGISSHKLYKIIDNAEVPRRVNCRSRIPREIIEAIRYDRSISDITLPELANKYNLGISTISRVIYRNNIPNKIGITEEQKKSVINDYLYSDLTLEKIAQKHNVSYSSVNRIISDNNIPRRNK